MYGKNCKSASEGKFRYQEFDRRGMIFAEYRMGRGPSY